MDGNVDRSLIYIVWRQIEILHEFKILERKKNNGFVQYQ